MPAWKAELYTIDDVMEYYMSAPQTAFIVYAGNRPDDAYIRYEHYGTKQEGERILHEALKALEQSRLNTNVYLLQIIEKLNDKPTAKKRVAKAKQITFQLNGITGYIPGSVADQRMLGMGSDREISGKLDKLIELMTPGAVAGQLAAAAPAPEPDRPTTLADVVSGFLERDDVQQGVVGLMFGMAEKFGLAPAGSAAAAMNAGHAAMGSMSADQDPLLQEAVARLKDLDPELGHDLKILAEIAEQDPSQFKMLIGALRAQKK